MKKVSKILLLVGGGLTVLGAVGVFIFGICLMNSQPLMEQLINILSQQPEVPQEAIQWLRENGQAAMIGAGIGTMFSAVPSLIAGIVALVFGARSELTKGLAIAMIVVDVLLGGGIIVLVGAILGLISAIKDAKKAKQEEIDEDAQELEEVK